jgi:transcriptional regulator with XRE-family HTH domain
MTKEYNMPTKITSLGKILRIFRIDHDMKQNQMAELLGISTAFLSAIEVRAKQVPDYLIDKMAEVMNIEKESEPWFKLLAAHYDNRGSIPIDISACTPEKSRVAIEFARTLPLLSDSELDTILKILRKKKAT